MGDVVDLDEKRRQKALQKVIDSYHFVFKTEDGDKFDVDMETPLDMNGEPEDDGP